MLRRVRGVFALLALGLAGCGGSDAVAPPRMIGPAARLASVNPASLLVGDILNQDLELIWVGAVETLGFGLTQAQITDCTLTTGGYAQCYYPVYPSFWPFYNQCLQTSCTGGLCNLAGYPFSGSPCYANLWAWADAPTTVWMKVRVLPTTFGRYRDLSGIFGQLDGNFYVFDRWITSSPCVEGTQKGLTCTFSFTATTHPDGAQDFSAVPVYRVSNYHFGGFLAPVSGTDVNTVKAGSGVPVKFSLGGSFGLGILAAGSPTSNQVACPINNGTSSIDQTSTAGASVLTFDAATGTYTYVWKTEKAWAGSCRQLTLTLLDGQSFTASFQFTK